VTAVDILRSPLLDLPGVRHGWPTRAGGVSLGKRGSLNLGYRWGDEPALVDENRRRVAVAAGYDPARLQVTKHVHGTNVWVVGDLAPLPAEFDALVTDRTGDVLGAFAADCIPMLMVDPVRRVVAAAHAGWRGTVGQVAVRAVDTMISRFGCSAGDIRVALGPSIGPCCFEVGPEVVTAFENAFPATPGLIVPGPNKPHVDLRVATRTQLEAAGIAAAHIDDRPPCTRCNPQRFFSFRRDGQEGGVHMGFIGLM
jgi:polyphenol oxidase